MIFLGACRTPCARWINPAESYQLRTESGPDLETVEVPDLRGYATAGELEVRAHPRNTGAFLGGIVTAGVGGGLAFIGGFLALAGGMGDRDGLLVAGGITISVSDGLDTREEHAKVAYQFRGIINELYLTELKKKTHRGQMGQVLGGFSVGSRGYGYASVPDGETKHDKKGRLRADGFKLVIVPEEARIIQRIFRDFIDGKAVTKIDGVFPTKRCKKGFEGKQRSYVESHPNHLLSGSLKCGACGGAIRLVSGKGSGYYGCLDASRRACENKVLIARKRLEDKFVAALN